MKAYKLSYYLVVTDLLDEASDTPNRMVYATRSGKALIIKDNIYQLLVAGDFDKVPMEMMTSLLANHVIVRSSEDELTSILEENEIEIDNGDSLGYTIQPGANCQLGCDYCGQEHTEKTMSDEHQEKMLLRIESMIEPRHKGLSITWYGGEPILALKQIRALTPRLKAMAKKHGLTYFADMITNGLGLKTRVFEELAGELDVSHFQITLDGTAKEHDQRRITKKGGNTFDTIVKNIVKATNNPIYQEKGCSIVIRCNINNSNKEDIRNLVWYLASLDLKDKITFDFQPVTDWGDNEASDNSMSKEEFGAYEIERMIEVIQLGFTYNNFIPTRNHAVCMVVDEKSEVFDAYGNIYSCWEVPYTPVYEGSDFQYGHLDKDPSEFRKDPMRDWNSSIPTNDSWCKSCKFLPVCGGGCPKKWLEKTPACPSFKFNIEDRLVLEYLTNRTNNVAQLLTETS
jgi:uncharacterized protein